MHLIVLHLNLLRKLASGLLQYIMSMARAWGQLKNHLRRPTRKPLSHKSKRCKRRRRKRLTQSPKKSKQNTQRARQHHHQQTDPSSSLQPSPLKNTRCSPKSSPSCKTQPQIAKPRRGRRKCLGNSNSILCETRTIMESNTLTCQKDSSCDSPVGYP